MKLNCLESANKNHFRFLFIYVIIFMTYCMNIDLKKNHIYRSKNVKNISNIVKFQKQQMNTNKTVKIN